MINIQNDNKIRFAVIGCGHIGKRHAKMIINNPGCQLIALVDKKEKSQLDLIDFDDIPLFSDIELMLKKHQNDIDVVCIATPNGLHAEHALIALSFKKHVVIEKPIALNKVDAEKILYEALRQNCQVFAVMQNRYSPPSVWLKDIIERDLMGKIFMVQVNCFWNRDARYYANSEWHGTRSLDGGTLFTQFSHFIDILYWIFGDLSDIKSKFATFNHKHLTDFEDSGVIQFCLNNGAIGTFSFTTSVWDKNMESSLSVIAENGSVKIGGQYMNEIEYCHISNYDMPVLAPTNPPNDYGAYKGSAANHHFIFQNVVDVLNGHAPITTNALEGLKVVDIIQRFYDAGSRHLNLINNESAELQSYTMNKQACC
jgi:UDP-N-acetyl-2-amino-2-deoxyglucuronate dehydrogenase